MNISESANHAAAAPANWRMTLVNLISALFIGLFIYTASDKLFTIAEFTEFIAKLKYLNAAPELVAFSIPTAEILVSLLLLFPQSRKTGLVASLFLMTAFTIYLIYMKITMENLPCHCGGVISRLNWTQHIWFNLLFTLMAIAGISLQRKHQKGI